MKKLIYSTFTMAIAALSLFSCSDVPAPYDNPNGGNTGGTTSNVIFSEDFSTGQGGFTFSDVTLTGGLTSVWKATSYNSSYYLIASAYYNKASHSSESWAVSPAIDLGDSHTATLTFDHAINKLTNVSNIPSMMTVGISTDYAGDAKTATWKAVSVPKYPAGTSWTFNGSGDIALDQYCGQKKVYVGFKYASTDNDAGSWEVSNFKIVGDGTPMVKPNPNQGTGDGSKTNPYNVTAVLSKTTESNVWTKGYIVGYIYGMTLSDGKVFSADTCTVTSNVLLAANANETNIANCIPIQLPKGSVRDGLNLSTNKGNLKKEVILYGSLDKYFNAEGVKSVSCAIIDGNTIGTDPTVPSGDLLNEPFSTSQGQFTIENPTMPSALTSIWSCDTKYGCMKASAYVSASKTSYASDSWLISPSIDMSKVSTAALSFDQACNKTTDDISQQVSVKVSTDYVSGDPAKATWTTLTFNSWPNSFTFITSSADLKSFSGKSNIHIAFEYTSTASKSITWEIKNVNVK